MSQTSIKDFNSLTNNLNKFFLKLQLRFLMEILFDVCKMIKIVFILASYFITSYQYQ